MPLRPSPSHRSRGCPTTGRHPYPSLSDAERALSRREAEGRAVHCKACSRWHAVVEHSRKKAIPRASGKKREEIRVRKQQRAELHEERGDLCETGCGRPWVHVHEVLSRGRGGSAVDKDNALCLCSECHGWAHRNPEAATAFGLMRSALPGEARKVVPRPYGTIPKVTK